MNCPKCSSSHFVKDGKGKSGSQRFLCKDCNYEFSVSSKDLENVVENRLSNTELAYLAGIIDGEGSLILERRLKDKKKYPGYHCYTPLIMVTNTNKEMLLWVAEKFSRYSKTTVKVYNKNPPSYAGLNRKQAYYVVITGFKLRSILTNLMPYLICKREQAQLLIKWVKQREHLQYCLNERRPYGAFEEEIKQKISILNKRGVD